MATSISSPTRSPTATVEGDQCVVMRGLGWKGYATMLRLRGERSLPRVIYCDGDLFLVSPSFIHERFSERLGLFIMVIVEEMDITCKMAGHTTFRGLEEDAGVEGDKTFYLANADRFEGKGIIDVRTDPPPDLAIEAVHTHEASTALEVYRRLRVPEVWVCEKRKLQIFARRKNGRYSLSEASVSFPFLKADEIFAWVVQHEEKSDNLWVKKVRPRPGGNQRAGRRDRGDRCHA